MFFVNTDCLSKKDAEILKTQIEQQAKEHRMLELDYKARLKDDMVVILEELKEEISDYHEIGCDKDCDNCRMVGCVEPVDVIKDLDIIQQKINKLKGDNNDY